MTRKPKFITNTNDSESILGGLRNVKLSSEETDGDVYLVEGIMPEGSIVPLHIHTKEDEIFHILEGCVELVLGEQTFVGNVGDIIFLPRGVKHGIKTLGKHNARVLNYVIPGKNFEDFFTQMNEYGKDITSEQRSDLANKYGITFL